MIDTKGNDICPKCGVKIDGGYCECFQPHKPNDVKKITVEYMNGEIKEVIKGYLISLDGEGNSDCIRFHV